VQQSFNILSGKSADNRMSFLLPAQVKSKLYCFDNIFISFGVLLSVYTRKAFYIKYRGIGHKAHKPVGLISALYFVHLRKGGSSEKLPLMLATSHVHKRNPLTRNLPGLICIPTVTKVEKSLMTPSGYYHFFISFLTCHEM